MKPKFASNLIPIYSLILSLFICIAVAGNRAITVISENAPILNQTCIVIDAGHGGIDGGAVSCSGKLESAINLQIAQRLNDLMHLLGFKTYMLRHTDRSLHTYGKTIAAQKASDLKERVRLINETQNAILLSIHQNYFPDSQYSGPQVFYSNTADSKELASQLQSILVQTLAPSSTRREKASKGVYLMEHINCTGVLIECGFLSNPEEEARLINEIYQKKLCCVIASGCSQYLKSAQAIA